MRDASQRASTRARPRRVGLAPRVADGSASSRRSPTMSTATVTTFGAELSPRVDEHLDEPALRQAHERVHRKAIVVVAWFIVSYVGVLVASTWVVGAAGVRQPGAGDRRGRASTSSTTPTTTPSSPPAARSG